MLTTKICQVQCFLGPVTSANEAQSSLGLAEIPLPCLPGKLQWAKRS